MKNELFWEWMNVCPVPWHRIGDFGSGTFTFGLPDEIEEEDFESDSRGVGI